MKNKLYRPQNMSTEDAMEYLKDMTQFALKRPDGLEGDLFNKIDKLNKERKEVEDGMNEARKRMDTLTSRHQHIVGSVDALANVLIEQEDARRAV
jgi:hypothetical protein